MEDKYIICNGELKHYGVPGMKWGRRKELSYKPWSKYNNMTEKTASNTQGGYDAGGNRTWTKTTKNGPYKRTIGDRLDTVSAKKLGASKGIAENAGKGFNEMGKIAGKMGGNGKPSKAQKKQLSQMSDQELRARINRMQMEQQYASLSPSRRARGAEAARSILETAGSVAAVAGSALGIAVAIKQLREGKNKGYGGSSWT